MASFDEVMRSAGITPNVQRAEARKRKIGTDEKLASTEERTGGLPPFTRSRDGDPTHIPTSQGVRRIKLDSPHLWQPPMKALRSLVSTANLLKGTTNKAAEGINARKGYRRMEEYE